MKTIYVISKSMAVKDASNFSQYMPYRATTNWNYADNLRWEMVTTNKWFQGWLRDWYEPDYIDYLFNTYGDDYVNYEEDKTWNEFLRTIPEDWLPVRIHQVDMDD